MLLLSGNAKAIISSLAFDRAHYGWLLTPRRTMTRTGLFGLRYAVDNECFTPGVQFDGARFMRTLRKIKEVHSADGCLFVVAPDVVGNAVETLRKLLWWGQRIRNEGFPVALAAQDGLESLPVPWDEFDALFIGGSTEWKLSRAAADLAGEAKAYGKWVHVGRVNSVRRASRLLFEPDSVDGTAWAKHPAEYAIQWRAWVNGGKPRQAALQMEG